MIDSCEDQQLELLMPKHESSQVQEIGSCSDSKCGVEGLRNQAEKKADEDAVTCTLTYLTQHFRATLHQISRSLFRLRFRLQIDSCI